LIQYVTSNTVLLVYRTMDDVPGQLRCHEHAVSLVRRARSSRQRCALHARLGDYACLQAAAMKLFTTFKKDKYLVVRRQPDSGKPEDH